MDVVVVDASLVVDLLDRPEIRPEVARTVGDPQFIAPVHFHLEAVSGVRRKAAAGEYEDRDPGWRVSELALFPVDLVGAAPFLERIWELRHNLTVYDAAYVSLAEVYECPVISTDRKLSRTPNLPVEVITF